MQLFLSFNSLEKIAQKNPTPSQPYNLKLGCCYVSHVTHQSWWNAPTGMILTMMRAAGIEKKYMFGQWSKEDITSDSTLSDIFHHLAVESKNHVIRPGNLIRRMSQEFLFKSDLEIARFMKRQQMVRIEYLILGIPGFCDFTIPDPCYFVILFQASIL